MGRDFPGGPEVKTSPSNPSGAGCIGIVVSTFAFQSKVREFHP